MISWYFTTFEKRRRILFEVFPSAQKTKLLKCWNVAEILKFPEKEEGKMKRKGKELKERKEGKEGRERGEMG